MVVDVNGEHYAQRFYRARPAAIPTYAVSVSASQNVPNTPTTMTTPKANDSRNRVAPNYRDSLTPLDWSDSPGSRTWTSRERIKAATCLSLSRDGKYLAVGETGYAPRVLIFNLQDASSDTPLVSINEHAFGVTAVAWSADSRYLASLGAANDGFLYVWRVDNRTGQTKLFQQNRCTSFVRHMVWLGNSLITLGVRHVKVWKIDEGAVASPTKSKFLAEPTPSTPNSQKALPGRNIVLGPLLDTTFSCAAVDGNRLIICTETGDVCIMDDDDKNMKLIKVLSLNFPVNTISIKGNVAYVGGKDGRFATLNVDGVMDGRENSVIDITQSTSGVLALGFLTDQLVTIDSKHSIDVWNSSYIPGQDAKATSHIHIPGHGESVIGIHPLEKPNRMHAAFLTWSSSGNVTFWDLDGRIKSSIDVPMAHIEEADPEAELMNQLTCVKTTKSGRLLVTADRLGILKVTDVVTKECLLDIKAHSLDCTGVSLYEEDARFLMACCGRDRTAQLFHRTSNGNIEHFQTIEFSAKVVQVLIPSNDRVITCSWDRTMQIHDLVTREGDPDMIAAIPTKTISLKASPTSMVMSQDNRTVFVSMLDRSICQYDLYTGRPANCFKCMDESGMESAVLEAISIGQWSPRDLDFLLGASNTDKSIRLYDASTGAFLDREWGHTEAINGVCLIEDDDGSRKVVSGASDGTIMIWSLDLNEPSPRSISRDPSPSKEQLTSRPPLRKVLSKAELAEFQRPLGSSPAGRRSPPRTVQRRTSRLNLSSNVLNARTPTGPSQISPRDTTINEDTPSRRRPSETSRPSSPPSSPKARITKRPSLPALGATARKQASSSNMRGFGSLNMATEQACRTLRAYRKKLSSAEPITAEALTELDQELRFTAAALGDRAIRSKAMNETVLSGLLDQYSERLVTMLDERLRLSNPHTSRETDNLTRDRRGSADGSSTTSST